MKTFKVIISLATLVLTLGTVSAHGGGGYGRGYGRGGYGYGGGWGNGLGVGLATGVVAGTVAGAAAGAAANRYEAGTGKYHEKTSIIPAGLHTFECAAQRPILLGGV